MFSLLTFCEAQVEKSCFSEILLNCCGPTSFSCCLLLTRFYVTAGSLRCPCVPAAQVGGWRTQERWSETSRERPECCTNLNSGACRSSRHSLKTLLSFQHDDFHLSSALLVSLSGRESDCMALWWMRTKTDCTLL